MMDENKTEEPNDGEKKDPETSNPLTGRRYARRMGDVHGQEEGSALWLVTFTDVMALMLTFFVLLFSMSKTETTVWTEMTSALRTELGSFYGDLYNEGPLDEINLDRIKFNQALNLHYLKALMDEALVNSSYLQDVNILEQEDRLIVSLPQELLFDAGHAEVKEDGARALYTLGGALSRVKNKIEIVGHTDPRPLNNPEGDYKNNWELSMARAANVALILRKVGYGKDITMRGMASGRYEDLSSISNEQERLSLSRRVDIIIMDHDGRRAKVFFDSVQ